MPDKDIQELRDMVAKNGEMLQAHITSSNAQHKDLRDALVGDEFGNTGIVKRLELTEERSNYGYKFAKNAKKTLRVVWGVIASFLAWLANEIFG